MKHLVLVHPGGASPPEKLNEHMMLVLACSVLHVPQDQLSVHEDLLLVMHHRGNGRFSYVCFDKNGEMEVFHPRCFHQNPRRVPC